MGGVVYDPVRLRIISMPKIFSAAFAVGLLLAGAALMYKQVSEATPFVVHIFALGGLLATAGVAWMYLDIAGPEN